MNNVNNMMVKTEFAAQTTSGSIYRKFVDPQSMTNWFDTLKGSTLQNILKPVKITTTIEEINNDQSETSTSN